MAQTKRKRENAKKQHPPSAKIEMSDESGVVVYLDSSDDKTDVAPPPWPANLLENVCSLREQILNGGKLPSILDIGTVVAKNTFKKMARRNQNKKKSTAAVGPLKPTPIQRRLWPMMLDSLKALSSADKSSSNPCNIIGIAPTGSGKTMAYVVPIVSSCIYELLHRSKITPLPQRSSFIHSLVIVPTRELAAQVSKEFCAASKVANQVLSEFSLGEKRSMTVKSLAVFGGVDIQAQISQLSFPMNERFDMIMDRCIIVAATPGRLGDFLNKISKMHTEKPAKDAKPPSVALNPFSFLRAIVYDEADQMVECQEMAKQVNQILDILNVEKNCQNGNVLACLISATLPQKVMEVCGKWVQCPRFVVKVDSMKIGNEKTTSGDKTNDEKSVASNESRTSVQFEEQVEEATDPAKTALSKNCRDTQGKAESKEDSRDISQLNLASIPPHFVQTVRVCSNYNKRKALIKILRRLYSKPRSKDTNGKQSSKRSPHLCIIFFSRIKTIMFIRDLLCQEGFRVTELFGKQNQRERDRRLLDFKSGKKLILLATDIAARGIHIPNVHHVINFDFPTSLDQYVHRCGRAGRKNLLTGVDADDPPTIHSFFTRELAPMAGSVVELLQACKSFVDPRLLALSQSKEATNRDDAKLIKNRRQEKKRKREASASETGVGDIANDIDSEEDEFSYLRGNRIALKRAAYVSDAEENNDESDNDDRSAP